MGGESRGIILRRKTIKRLGLLIPPVNVVMEPELNHWSPPSMTVHAHRLYRDPIPTLTPESLMTMIDRLEESASLLAMAKVDLIVFGCTSASVLEGAGWDENLSQRIEATTDIPAVATATAVKEALRSLGITRITVVTPYPDEVNRREAAFLESGGFSVVNLDGLGIKDSYQIPVTPPEQIYQLARGADRPEAEGIFISCTNFPAATVINRLELDTAKPVVTSNSASQWFALKKLGVSTSIDDGGKLLTSLQLPL